MELMKRYYDLIKKRKAYRYALQVVGWDSATEAPKNAFPRRMEMMGVLSGEVFKLATSKESQEVVNGLMERLDELEPHEQRQIKRAKKEMDKILKIPQEEYVEYQKLIGLSSSGIHSNGYSLVRKIFFKDNNYKLTDHIETLGCTLQEELLKPTRIYVKGILEAIYNVDIHSIAHITGGGFIENIPRALPEHLGVSINEQSIPKLPIFSLLEELGNIKHNEMYNIFNMGIGMVVIVDEENTDKATYILNKHGYDARVIGEVTSIPGVTITNE